MKNSQVNCRGGGDESKGAQIPPSGLSMLAGQIRYRGGTPRSHPVGVGGGGGEGGKELFLAYL